MRFFYPVAFFLFLFQTGFAQQSKNVFTVRGKIIELETGEAITRANIFNNTTNAGTSSNDYGVFFIKMPQGLNSITASSIGYITLQTSVNITSDTVLILKLEANVQSLDEVIISSDADRVNSLRIGSNTINLQTIKRIPPLLGEPDLIRSLLLLPGITTVGEGATGFNVRGGGIDQNLVLLDDAPIFNTAHLFGFLTAFNSYTIGHADLFKAGIPASFGGRASSVLDVKIKQGNNQKIGGQAGIGLMSANLFLEGPVTKKTTFLTSIRGSYSDWLLKTVPEPEVNQSKASFYDATLKISHQFNENNQLSLTGYISNDAFKFAGDTTYRWNTQNFTLRWGTLINKKLFLVTSAVSSNYGYSINGRATTNEFNWQAGINYKHLKSDLSIQYNDTHKGEVGIGINNYSVNLGELEPESNSNINTFNMEDERALIGFAYYSHQAELNSRLSMQAGIRASIYYLVGPGAINNYEPGKPLTGSTWIGRTPYSRGEIIKQYGGFEPRLSFRWQLNSKSSIKGGFDQTIQYIHLVSNTSAVSPIDLWKLSDTYLAPQKGKQVSVGYFRNLANGKLSLSTEIFYKTMFNLVDYKDGAELLLNDQLETDLLQGSGRAFGTEWMLEKNTGKLTGWISYTLARTERKIEGTHPEETINKGNYYPANFDKLHNLSVTGSYQKTKQVSFGFNFVFSSGRPITYPTASYNFGGIRVVNYELRNNQRSPAYHRLDISMEIKSKQRTGRSWQGAWVVSLYNVYARKNPYSIFFRSDYGVRAQAYRLAVIGTIIPSLAYSIKF